MPKTYKVKVNDSYEFLVNSTTLKSFDFVKKSETIFHVVDKHKTFLVEKEKSSNFDKKKYMIQVNGNVYHIKIESELDQLIDQLGLKLNDKQKDRNIKAPMPGLILEISIKEGDEVKEGDSLLILEAMKMENILTAPKDGTVKSVHISVGDSVEKTSLLIEME